MQRLTLDSVTATPIGAQAARGFPAGLEAWRVVSVSEDVGRRLVVSVPFVGREEELELLENTFARAVRDRRALLLTIFGEAGVGKSRLAREFTAGAERATVLSGRCLPYGEGVTYWALAEMVKAAAGITDDDTVEAATEKLRASCGEDAVADLLGLASGVLDAVGGERSPAEISWAAQTWATELADVQPLVLVFEDIHWAEESMLDLIEHLAGAVRGVAVFILCLSRADLLDDRPTWGGGKIRASAIELEALPNEDGGRLVDALGHDGTDGHGLSAEQRAEVLEITEGNPLFIEEMVRTLLECDGPRDGLPHTVQAMIAARIDRLPRAEKAVLQRAAVAGRVFWSGAVDSMMDGTGAAAAGLAELVERDFLVREQRSTIRGEEAYRFKHVLIRDVAYAGLSKSTRALLHRRLAHWLMGRPVADELVEIRAYHLDEAAELVLELEGRVPAELAEDAAAVLEHAGRRAHAREANRTARRLFVRAVELEPTLERRYLAARAAWRMTDMPTVSTEMQNVLDAAHEAGDQRIEGRALTVLAQVSLHRDGDTDRARELATHALEVIDPDDDVGRFDALELLGTIGWWEGDMAEVERLATEKLAIAEHIERRDLQSGVLLELTEVHYARLEPDLARGPLARARELAAESGSPTTRALTLRVEGKQAAVEGRLDEAEESLEQARELFAEGGVTIQLARTLNALGLVAWTKGDLRGAEERLREAIRLLKPLEDRGTLVESQRILAQVLLGQHRLEEAERLALDALETVGPGDASSSSTTRLALGLVRAAQGKDDEAERLLRESIEIVRATGFRRHETEPLAALAGFLRERGRAQEALPVEEALAALIAGRAVTPAVGGV